MLVCLSEFYCLPALNQLDVYPDEYFTDYELFKHRLVSMVGVDLLVVLAGTCRFNKRHIIEFLKLTMRNVGSNGSINKVYIVTDTAIPALSEYYKFTGSIRTVDLYHGWKKVKAGVDLWGILSSEPKESNVYLAVKDTGDTSSFIAAWEKRKNSEDELQGLIRIADVKAMLGTR